MAGGSITLLMILLSTMTLPAFHTYNLSFVVFSLFSRFPAFLSIVTVKYATSITTLQPTSLYAINSPRHGRVPHTHTNRLLPNDE